MLSGSMHLQMPLPTNFKEQQQFPPFCKKFHSKCSSSIFFIWCSTLSLIK